MTHLSRTKYSIGHRREILVNALPSGKGSFQGRMKAIAILAAIFLVSSCAYKHYLGLHGTSIKKYPSVHDFTADQSCLLCHGPGSSVASPKMNHPQQKGCLKCHGDVLTRASADRRDRPVKTQSLIHADPKADRSCLMCHGPGSTVIAPKTSHANFKGCLKCHNDEPTAGS